ncbi:MAG: dTDP-4-dehydrorhamnose 3,5-epimerase [Rhizobiaceae bacterium]|jgi:dTDP-4-dehydrorhamnose 3,5-epimerase|nr:dTDP-4-dehydrorhamnose 3,5-epimerase [Rhizobiaceae bacterium]
MPQFRRLAIPDLIEVIPDRHGDERGFFSEVFSAGAWAAGGVTAQFMQDNHSYSQAIGVLRGLHFQTPPFAQAKLVRVTRGAVFDVAVDIRAGSPTFGQWDAIELSADKWNQLYIPEGFAHGFLTLTPDVEFVYKVSAPYSKAHDRSIRFDDPAIGIDWPVVSTGLTLSDKDRNALVLAEVDTGFTY